MIRKEKLKRISIGVIFFLGTIQIQAQQDPQYTQYMYNPTMINPAYAGSRGNLSIYGNYRTQWVGLEGAPKTATLAASSPIGASGLGMGINFANDNIGAMDENNIALDISYTIDLNVDYRLALGLKGSANLLNVDYTKLTIHNVTDPVVQDNITNKFSPNLGAGIFLYSEIAYLGVSIPNFLTTERYDDNMVTTMRQKAHLYVMGGYVFDLDYNVKFKPAFLAKSVAGSPLQVDLTANFLLHEKFTLGAAYRWDASISALAGFQLNYDLFIGYSYDAETSKLSNYNSGSHEIIIKYEIFNRPRKIKAPRFF
ncbi:type IX secretion system membrane protein PorP/SprF [Myroides odoratus]